MKKFKKPAYIIIFVALVITGYILISEGYGQAVDFTELKASTLPAGLQTTNGEFYVLQNRGFWPSFDKHIDIALNEPNSWIGEWKSDGHLTNPCSDFPQETDCHNYKAPGNQQYQLTAGSSNKSGYYFYDVRFIKDGTEVWITVPEIKQNIPVATWSSAVNSFKPGHYSGLKVIHGGSSGP